MAQFNKRKEEAKELANKVGRVSLEEKREKDQVEFKRHGMAKR